MVKNNPADFVCPGCQAGYKLVRTKSDPRSRYLPVHCKVCKQPLAATDGEDILKYFLIRRPSRKSQAGWSLDGQNPSAVTAISPPRSLSPASPCSPAPTTRVHHAEAFFGRPLFTHALGHVGKHIELGHEHQPTFALSPSALLKAGADRHCPPSSLPW